MFVVFYAYALREKRGIPVMHKLITLMTFTRFAQNSTAVSMLALYGSTMHVATL